MKQYCRYCVWLCVNNVPYCDKKKEIRSKSSCMHTNKCKDFHFADCEPEYQDAFGITNGYKPRKPRHSQQIEGQLELDV
jgi:hypothetical protein